MFAFQEIVVYLLVGLSFAWLVWRLVQFFRTAPQAKGCNGACASCPLKDKKCAETLCRTKV